MERNSEPPGMVWVPGGTFLMGSNRHYPEEAPAHQVHVDAFWMDRHCVTNAQFAEFVAATGYVTLAERPIEPASYPQADPALLVPGSAVFHPTDGPVDLSDCTAWWRYVPGACWRAPEGPGSSLAGRQRHPVVHLAYEDAEAYARYRGKALPTEAEWERAARGERVGAEFCWGDELLPDGKSMANWWQGEFPWENLALDGYAGTAPVGAFPPNDFGLFDMAGNVWQWTQDFYRPRHLGAPPGKACCIPRNPRGPSAAASLEPGPSAPAIPRRVLKGGSFLCAANFCYRYRPAARYPQAVDTSTAHVGFRCVLRPGLSAASG